MVNLLTCVLSMNVKYVVNVCKQDVYFHNHS